MGSDEGERGGGQGWRREGQTLAGHASLYAWHKAVQLVKAGVGERVCQRKESAQDEFRRGGTPSGGMLSCGGSSCVPHGTSRAVGVRWGRGMVKNVGCDRGRGCMVHVEGREV